MRTFISFEEARNIVMESAPRLADEHVPLQEALGRTLAKTIVANEDSPPFDNSAMDGYAVLRKDCQQVPTALSVIGEIPAGAPFDGTLIPGTCARIMTGAPMPNGADAVVPIEKTTEDGETVLIKEYPGEHAHIRRAGEDFLSGDIMLTAGITITPPVVGMLATLGAVPVPVAVRPKVSVISTGDEIVSPDAIPGRGQIRNSNGPALAAQVVSAGGKVRSILHAPDDPARLGQTVEEAAGSDVILFSGGVSMGKYDFVRTILEEMGAKWDFWKVQQRPGKPLIFGKMNSVLLVGLPGNPVSSAMCFEMYIRPLLARMLGRQAEYRPLVQAKLGRRLPKVKNLHYFSRGVAEKDDTSGETMVVDTGPQGSNLYSSVVKANCIIHLPPEMENPGAGTPVMIEWLGW